MSQPRRRLLVNVLAASAWAVLTVALYLCGAFEMLELKTLDRWFRQIPRWSGASSPADIVVVSVDQGSLEYVQGTLQQRWPWPREFYGKMIGYLTHAGARAIVFDMYFTEPDIERLDVPSEVSDAALEKATSDSGRVVHTYVLLRDGQPPYPEEQLAFMARLRANRALDEQAPSGLAVFASALLPSPALISGSLGLGFANILPEEDNIVRRIPLVAVLTHADQRVVVALSTATFWNLAGKPPLNLLAGALEAGDVAFPIDVEGRAFLWWYPPADGQASAFPQYSAAEVLKAAVQIELGRSPTLSPSLFSNKVVFVGASAPGLFDIKTTPLIRTRVVDGRETSTTATPGFEVQATALANLLRNDLVRRISSWVVLAGIVVICLGVGVAARGMRHAALGLSVTIGILLVSSAGAYGSLRAGHCLFDVVPLWFAALGTFLECTFINYLWERRHAKVVRGIFEHYLDSSVVRTLINNPERVRLGGELRHCTVLFSDVANFTHTSERMSPEQLVHFMNIYLDAMTDVIVQSGGFVDKFVGDEIVAIFGAPNELPDHPARACAAIARMCKKVEELQEAFVSMGCVPPVFARTGISTGPMVVGNMGSENRMNYTAMGDVMNLGARLEGVNKVYGTRVIVSEPTRQTAGDQFAFRELDSIKVKGKDKGTPIHEFLGMAGDVDDAVRKRVGRYAAGLSLYRERRWTEARACFDEAAALGDEPARMMSGRCLEYATQPPPIDWDGSYTMLSK